MTFSTFAFFIALAGAIGWPVALLLGARAAPLRRSTLLRVFAALVTLAWAGGVWATFIEPRTLVVKDVEVRSALWRGAPLRIGIVSDVHVVAPHMTPTRVRRIVSRINALDADLVLIAGDLVGHHLPRERRNAHVNADIVDGLAAFREIGAPLGAVAALGNHDWWWDGWETERRLTDAGVVVLDNAAVRLERDGGDVWIAGLADYESRRSQPDWTAALGEIPEDADVVAVAHWPDVFAAAPDRVALTVAGHSHCGQIRLPWLGGPAASAGSKRWPCGLFDGADRAKPFGGGTWFSGGSPGSGRGAAGPQLFVTGGVGVSVLPIRFLTPPEIVVITLRGD